MRLMELHQINPKDPSEEGQRIGINFAQVLFVQPWQVVTPGGMKWCTRIVLQTVTESVVVRESHKEVMAEWKAAVRGEPSNWYDTEEDDA